MSHLVLHTRVVSGSGGGPDKTILNSPRYLEASGYPMLCAYMRHPDDEEFARLEAAARRWGAPLVGVDDFGPLDWRLPRRFAELLAEHRPAIWHAHDYKSNLLGLRLARLARLARMARTPRTPRTPRQGTGPAMRLVTTVHGWGVQGGIKTPLYYAFDRLLVRRYEEVICVSEDLRQRCLRHGVPPERCWLVPNAIDTEEFRRRGPAAQAASRAGVPARRLVVGAVGRLSPEKAFDDLVRAVTGLVAAGHDLELWIVGDGPQRQALTDLIDQLGMTERVKLLGYRGDTLELYQAMDVFVLSSRREGLPNVVLEAMALELPVVATRIAGVPTLIRDGENGLLVEPGAPPALTGAIGRLLASPARRRELGTAARRTIEERHSMTARMESVRRIYDVALGLAERPVP